MIAVDTGYGQIDFRLAAGCAGAASSKKTNARYLTGEQVGETIDLAVMDVAFISATLVLPAVMSAAFASLGTHGKKRVIVLVKPQFEVGREQVGKGGIVRDPALQAASVDKVKQSLFGLGCARASVIESPILGAEGNREFLLYATD